MSNLNVLNSIDEQLFTELTAEQSEMVEGGKFLYIESITCNYAGADPESKDDTYMKLVDASGSTTVLGETGMSTGSTKMVNFGKPFEGSAQLSLYDSDWWYDDFMGSIDVSTPTNQVVTAQTNWQGGSQYSIRYAVYG